MPPGNPLLFLLSRMTQLRESPCSDLDFAPCPSAQYSALNGSMAAAMLWRGKGSKFRLRERRKQEADMHKSMVRVLSLSQLLASRAPVLAHNARRRGAPQLGVNTATRALNKQRRCQGAKLKLPPLCHGPAHRRASSANCMSMALTWKQKSRSCWTMRCSPHRPQPHPLFAFVCCTGDRPTTS